MTTFRGGQVKLSQDRKEAEKAFHSLLAQEDPPEEKGGLRARKGAQAKKPAPVRFPSWGESTRTTARSVLRACLNWAVQQGYVPANPLAKLKRGEFTRRERILSADEKRRIAAWLPEGI